MAKRNIAKIPLTDLDIPCGRLEHSGVASSEKEQPSKKSLKRHTERKARAFKNHQSEFTALFAKQILWIRKFLRDFYFAIFSFSNYSRSLKFASKHSCSRPFPWVEDRRSLYFMRETN